MEYNIFIFVPEYVMIKMTRESYISMFHWALSVNIVLPFLQIKLVSSNPQLEVKMVYP